jgi:hypothetical protein
VLLLVLGKAPTFLLSIYLSSAIWRASAAVMRRPVRSKCFEAIICHFFLS